MKKLFLLLLLVGCGPRLSYDQVRVLEAKCEARKLVPIRSAHVGGGVIAVYCQDTDKSYFNAEDLK